MARRCIYPIRRGKPICGGVYRRRPIEKTVRMQQHTYTNLLLPFTVQYSHCHEGLLPVGTRIMHRGAPLYTCACSHYRLLSSDIAPWVVLCLLILDTRMAYPHWPSTYMSSQSPHSVCMGCCSGVMGCIRIPHCIVTCPLTLYLHTPTVLSTVLVQFLSTVCHTIYLLYTHT